jgi:hypothetical protein
MDPINEPNRFEALNSFPWKYYIILFFIFILITSNVFVRNVLDKMPNAVEDNSPTTLGTVVQGALLIGGGIVSTFLIDAKII